MYKSACEYYFYMYFSVGRVPCLYYPYFSISNLFKYYYCYFFSLSSFKLIPGRYYISSFDSNSSKRSVGLNWLCFTFYKSPYSRPSSCCHVTSLLIVNYYKIPCERRFLLLYNFLLLFITSIYIVLFGVCGARFIVRLWSWSVWNQLF